MIFYLEISKNMKQQKFNSHKANGSSFLYTEEFNFAQIHTVIFFPRKYYIRPPWLLGILYSLVAEDLRCCQAPLQSGGPSALAPPF